MDELTRIGPESGAIIKDKKTAVITGITGNFVINLVPCAEKQESL